MSATPCRVCGQPLHLSLVDLGLSPMANSIVLPDRSDRPEPFYPLHPKVCEACFLVQLPQFESPSDIFSDYSYFSSYSDSWLAHCRGYADRMVEDLGLGSAHRVVEIASNDGYLLQYFAARGVPVLGIEPAQNVAAVAQARGIPTVSDFFGTVTATRLAAAGGRADLLIANNVLAHVPDLNDFVAGLKILLRPGGTLTLEFPHVLRLLERCQFDTIYHEHFSYFWLHTVRQCFAAHGLAVIDSEELPTHGGSLRVFAAHAGERLMPSARVAELLAQEELAGMRHTAAYRRFAESVKEIKRGLLEFLIAARRQGKSVVGYGAAAKGNTLLNYAGIRTDFLDYVADRSPHKQGRLLPGSRIPIVAPERIAETRPDYVLVLPWNLRDEISEQLRCVREWNGRLVVPIPRFEVLP